MRCYLVRESLVTVVSQVPTSQHVGSDLIQSIRDLNQSRFPAVRLLAIWNALPGAEFCLQCLMHLLNLQQRDTGSR